MAPAAPTAARTMAATAQPLRWCFCGGGGVLPPPPPELLLPPPPAGGASGPRCGSEGTLCGCAPPWVQTEGLVGLQVHPDSTCGCRGGREGGLIARCTSMGATQWKRRGEGARCDNEVLPSPPQQAIRKCRPAACRPVKQANGSPPCRMRSSHRRRRCCHHRTPPGPPTRLQAGSVGSLINHRLR